jgi:small subunit ribosomal protein S20
VAHSLSAKKRIRQNEKSRARNRARKDALKSQTKSFMAAVAKGDKAAAGTELNKTVVLLDRLSVKGTLHRNTASRKRSRLARRLNALAAAKPA